MPPVRSASRPGARKRLADLDGDTLLRAMQINATGAG
jgi:hypothetical protein